LVPRSTALHITTRLVARWKIATPPPTTNLSPGYCAMTGWKLRGALVVGDIIVTEVVLGSLLCSIFRCSSDEIKILVSFDIQTPVLRCQCHLHGVQML
jgi:hypothetical protein